MIVYFIIEVIVMSNLVIDGDYKHFQLLKSTNNILGSQTSVELSKDTISKYEVLHIEYRKSIIDTIARGIICTYLIGPIGLLAIFTASNTYESYRLIDIEFKDNKKSRIKIKKKQFKELIKVL